VECPSVTCIDRSNLGAILALIEAAAIDQVIDTANKRKPGYDVNYYLFFL
jgi:hypothetical protein